MAREVATAATAATPLVLSGFELCDKVATVATFLRDLAVTLDRFFE